MKDLTIPKEVVEVSSLLHQSGFEAYLVGGCVRDLLMHREPKDWDITTNAHPEEIQKIFPDSFYENEFGTVGVKTQPFLPNGKKDREHDVVEVTTYRTESGYSDKRRPDAVLFSKTLEEDLERRDFTMNAIALSPSLSSPARGEVSSLRDGGVGVNYTLIDPYNGQKDIQTKLIRTVGNPNDRFSEDALRMIRAVRFHAELGFAIEPETFTAIRTLSKNINHIALERIRIELERIILSDRPSEGIQMLHDTGLLQYIMPELEKGIGVTQNLHHIYTVWEHNLLALKTCPSKKLEVRLAALLHDVGKPQTKRGNGKYATFYNHDHVGARIARKMLERLKFPRNIIDKTTLLVDQHLFYYNVDEVTEAAVRRVIARVGLENIKDLIDVRIGDRLGSGVPKAKPYRLRHFEYMVDKVSHDPISVKQLKISGTDLIKELSLKPGPKIGAVLDVLLGEVIEDASLNDRKKLLTRTQELDKEDLATLRKTAKNRIEQEKKKEQEAMKKKYWVK